MKSIKVTLSEKDMPKQWYNLAADLPTPMQPPLGHSFIPEPIHAGGLRYHGMSPLVSQGVVEGLLEPRAIDQLKCYEAAMLWARTEGAICAPETSHAIAATIDEAIRAREEGKEKAILFCYSGHGLMDLAGYDKFLSGELKEYSLPEPLLQEAVATIRHHPKPSTQKTGKW